MPRTNRSQGRRRMLAASARVGWLLAAAGVLPAVSRAQSAGAWNRAAFEARTVPELNRVLGLARPVESSEVTLTVPDIAENGAAVPVGAATAIGNVRRLLVLVEKNPNPLSAVFEVSEWVDASLSLRVKMAQSSAVYAVAVTADDRVLFARKDVTVTIGGCGG